MEESFAQYRSPAEFISTDRADPAEAFLDYIGEISLVKDFTSTMDAVLTEEEKAQMQEAEKQAEAEATGTKEAASAATAGVSTSGTATPAPGDIDGTAPTNGPAEGPGSHLAHHSSFSKTGAGGSAPTGGSTVSGAAKDATAEVQKDNKKGKAKLTPEQKAKLDELEAKRDEEKEKR